MELLLLSYRCSKENFARFHSFFMRLVRRKKFLQIAFTSRCWNYVSERFSLSFGLTAAANGEAWKRLVLMTRWNYLFFRSIYIDLIVCTHSITVVELFPRGGEDSEWLIERDSERDEHSNSSRWMNMLIYGFNRDNAHDIFIMFRIAIAKVLFSSLLLRNFQLNSHWDFSFLARETHSRNRLKAEIRA